LYHRLTSLYVLKEKERLGEIMEEWRIYGKKADFNALSEEFDIDPVIARVIRNREYCSSEEIRMYLNKDMSCLHNPWDFKDVSKAVDILEAKIKAGRKIRIIGDYDIDGICSVYTLIRSLKGALANVDYAIPNRIIDGYGINENLIKEAFDNGVDTIVTCDNGIAAKNQVDYANSLGMTVIITDHHEVPYVEEGGEKQFVIPNASAVIDPKREGCQYPFKAICGAVVAYKFMQALYERMNLGQLPKELEEFIAIATVGDIMPLRDENRAIVSNGLTLMNSSNNLGLSCLINEFGILEKRSISSYDIGFRIGPCLNSSGRLKNASDAVELFLTKDETKAKEIAKSLIHLNEERKNMTEKGIRDGILAASSKENEANKVLVIYLPNVHESLAGIVAGKIKEELYKPTLVITKTQDGILKGSARSIESYNMFEELNRVRHLFTKLGGHPMAAGFSLKEENLLELRRVLNENTTLKEEDLIKKIWIDTMLPVEYVSDRIIGDLEKLEPFGEGNPKPKFAARATVVEKRILGANENCVKLKLKASDGTYISGLYFGDGREFSSRINLYTLYSFIYYPSINEYNGRREIQIIINSIKPSQNA